MKMSTAKGMMNQAWLYSCLLQSPKRGINERQTPVITPTHTASANNPPKLCQSVCRRLTASMVDPANCSEGILFYDRSEREAAGWSCSGAQHIFVVTKRGVRPDSVAMPASLDDDFVCRSRLDEVLASFEVEFPQ